MPVFYCVNIPVSIIKTQLPTLGFLPIFLNGKLWKNQLRILLLYILAIRTLLPNLQLSVTLCKHLQRNRKLTKHVFIFFNKIHFKNSKTLKAAILIVYITWSLPVFTTLQGSKVIRTHINGLHLMSTIIYSSFILRPK